MTAPNHLEATIATPIEGRAIRTTERAVCELCGAIISTTDGRRHTGLTFISFERLLDLHMEHRHPNVCVLPPQRGMETGSLIQQAPKTGRLRYGRTLKTQLGLQACPLFSLFHPRHRGVRRPRFLESSSMSVPQKGPIGQSLTPLIKY